MASLACSLALLGCTTDRYPGAGAPERSGPAVGPSMPSATPGSESGQPIVHNASMASSYVSPLAAGRDVDALATIAADQGFRGRNLGPAAGDQASGVTGVENPTGQFINPAVLVNPQYTVNPAINSIGQTSVYSQGAVGIGGSTVTGVVVGPVTTSPSTAAITTSPTMAGGTLPTTAAVLNGNVGTTGTSTAAALSTPNAQSAATAGAPVFLNSQPLVSPGNVGNPLTATVSPSGIASPVAAANPPIGSLTTTPRPTQTIGVSTGAVTTTAPPGGSLAKPIVILQSANGGITITNLGTTSAAVKATGTTSTTGHTLVAPAVPVKP